LKTWRRRRLLWQTLQFVISPAFIAYFIALVIILVWSPMFFIAVVDRWGNQGIMSAEDSNHILREGRTLLAGAMGFVLLIDLCSSALSFLCQDPSRILLLRPFNKSKLSHALGRFIER